MLKTLRNILKTGDATVKYPFAPLHTWPDMRGKPEHDAVACIACGACAVACPPNAIQMQTDLKAGTTMWSIDYGRCIFCGRCEEVCPLSAISLESEFELAVMRKDDLIETCTYQLQACSECGEYFAPRKEVDYAVRLLSSMPGNPEVEEAAQLASVCPTCKRRRDAVAAKAADDAHAKAKGGEA
jgi:hydrogenase-4 component H